MKCDICIRTLCILVLACCILSCKKDDNPLSHVGSTNYKIVFTADNHLCIIDSDGENMRILASGASGSFLNWEADISSDGTMLVFAKADSDYRQIYLLDLETLGITNITNDLMYHESPVFSPDGKNVMFARSMGWKKHLFLKNLENGELKQLTYQYNCSNPSYSTDGSLIMFTMNNGLDSNGVAIMDNNGNNVRLLAPGIGLQVWPDGRQILFEQFIPPDSMGLFIMNIDGSNRQFLSIIPFQTISRLSPDGSRIVFSNFTRNFDIFLINSDGSNLKNLTNSQDAEFQPSFSPDGKQIIYISLDTVTFKHRLHIMDSDGGNNKILVQDVGSLRDPIL